MPANDQSFALIQNEQKAILFSQMETMGGVLIRELRAILEKKLNLGS